MRLRVFSHQQIFTFATNLLVFFLTMESDSALLIAASRMDKDALVRIFDLYSRPLYNYALRICGDPMLADHIVGDVFAKLLEQLAAGYGPRANLRSYLYESAYHRMIDEVRYSKPKAPLEVATQLPLDAYLSMEDCILFKQVLDAVQHKLSADQRHVIVLRFLEGFSLRETAAILNKDVDHIKVIQNRAIAKLRRLLESQGRKNPLVPWMTRHVSEALGIG